MLRLPMHHNRSINVITTQRRISLGRQHFKYAIFNLQYGYIKRTSPQIVYQHRLLFVSIQTNAITQTGCSGFIHDAQHLQSRQFPRIPCGLSLRIIKIRRHGNHRLQNIGIQNALRLLFQLPQDDGAQLNRIVKSIIYLHFYHRIFFLIDDSITQVRLKGGYVFITLAQKPFHTKYGSIRAIHQSRFCQYPHLGNTAIAKSNHRRHQCAHGIGDDFRSTRCGIHPRHQTIGGSQINPNHDLWLGHFPRNIYFNFCHRTLTFNSQSYC